MKHKMLNFLTAAIFFAAGGASAAAASPNYWMAAIWAALGVFFLVLGLRRKPD